VFNEVSEVSENNVIGRVDTFTFGVQAQEGETLTSPVYRLVIDVSYGSYFGSVAQGYYLRMNDSIYFISKQTIQVATAEQVTKVFAFLHKTKQLFTVSVRHAETLSGHQFVELHDISDDKIFYSVREFKVFKGLWRTIEGELFENLYTPSMIRYTSDKLDWYVKLVPEHSLQFTQVTSVSISEVATQGHLEVFKMPQVYTLPHYLYLPRKRLTFFNHSLEGDMYVVPLGAEQRIVHLKEETTVTSTDHDPVVLDVGEYLLVHPRPRKDAVD
jgi:hypothetical protein